MHSDTAASPNGHPPLPRFGEFELDLQARELIRVGRRIRLQEQPFQVLVMLIGRAGQVVTREELRQKLWPSSVYVDFDHGLNNAIGRLRETLGDVAATPRFIETLPRLGYRFIAPITHSRAPAGTNADAVTIASLAEADAAVPTLSARKPLWRRRGGIAAAAVVALAITAMLLIDPLRLTGPADETLPATAGVKAQSIAVLPFLDLSAGQDQGYLADGITEEILNRLTRAGNLRVISRTSSFVFRNKPLDIREVSEKLDVSHVLEGSIRRSGDTVRITAQLIAADDDSHVWSDTYERELGDLFAVQDEIAASVASALQFRLAADAARVEMPASIEAYERFLQGEFFYHRRAMDDVERAVKYYLEAVDLDPRYARAWAALAGAYALLEMRDQQGEAAGKAVALDPGLAVARARMAQFYYQTGQQEKGDEQWRAAVALDPDDPLVLGYTAARAVFRGDLEEAVAIWRRLAARDPLSAITRGNLGAMLLADGQLDEAVSTLRMSLELSPDKLNEQFDLIYALVLLEKYDEVEAAIARLPEGTMRDSGLAFLYRAPGGRADADAALKRLAAQPFDARDSIRLAEAYAFRGMDEKALAFLQEVRTAFERRQAQEPHLVWNFIEGLHLSPFLRPLHTDPRWAALLTNPS